MTMVIRDWISAPVASVAMNESIFMHHHDDPVDQADSAAVSTARATASAGRQAVETKYATATPAERHDEGDRQVEDARGERESPRARPGR